jgi:hypothetical protein
VDVLGPAERRLLAVERLLVHLENEARRNQRDLVELAQREWDAWGDWPPGIRSAAPPPPPPAATIPGCGGATTLTSVTLVDNVYGNFTLNWDGIHTYSGCKQITFTRDAICGGTPISLPLFYSWDTSTGFLIMKYLGALVPGGCPASGKTCASSPTGTNPFFSHSQQKGVVCHGAMTWNIELLHSPHPIGSGAVQTITLP